MNRDHQWKRTTRIWKIFQFWWNEILPPRANHKQLSTRGEKKQKSENHVADKERGKENSRGRVQTVSSWRMNIENTRDKWHLPLERDKARF